MAKKSTQSTALALMALLLIVGGIGMVWFAWKGIRALESQAAQTATAAGSSAALAGKTDWVGDWKSSFATLNIEAGGHADFTEQRAGSTSELHGNVVFEKETVVVDAIVTKKRWHIDKPPHVENGKTVMQLDGAEFVKQ